VISERFETGRCTPTASTFSPPIFPHDVMAVLAPK
jgi:hypothetical protein